MLSIGIIDIVIVALFILSIIWGFIQGFPKKRLSAFANSCGWLAAYCLGGFLYRWLASTVLSSLIQQGYQNLLPTSASFTAKVSVNLVENTSLYTTALSEINIPTFFQGFIINHVLDTTSTVAASIASSFAYLTIIVASSILVYLVVVIFVHVLLRSFWNNGSLFHEDGKSGFGRFCGMFRQATSTIFFVFSVMSVLSIFNQILLKNNATTLNDWLVNDLSLNDTSAFSLAKMFYNTADSFFNWITLPGF